MRFWPHCKGDTMPGFLLPLLTAGASLFGGAAKGSADQRQNENNQTQQKNQLLAQMYGMNQNATMNALTAGSAERLQQGNQELDRKQFALTAPRTRASQSVRGSILQNAQPLALSGLPDRVSSRIPSMSGGLTPAMFSADTRALGGEMTRSALIDQLKGDEFAPMEQTDFSKGVLPMPALEELKKSGLLEQIMGSLGLASSVGAGIAGAVQGSRRPANNYPIDPVGGG